jgi:hypothetical protein
MKCPHCNIAIHSGLQDLSAIAQGRLPLPGGGAKLEGNWHIQHQQCPECGETIIFMDRNSPYEGGKVARFMAYPQKYTRPVPPEVPDPYRQDYIEACKVLDDSAKASAALSRRNLQAVLRDKAGTKNKDLYDQIEEVINSGKVPSHVVEELHAVRNIGNFAAHTIKSTTTGAIVDVEPGEAEWNLDVLDSLFDFYFVQPAVSARRKAELNKKLKEAGKPELV